MMNNEGLRCAILKGQGVAALYNSIDGEWPQLGLYRQSGDIDVWVDGGMDNALKWCRKSMAMWILTILMRMCRYSRMWK